ncbi:MAG: M67 family metallopeptidase [Candidatus Dormibacteria bacterium]
MRFPEPLLEELRRHAEAAYPNEGCGVLLGHPSTGAGVTEVRPGRNLRGPDDRARDRYLLDPADILAAQRDADASGGDIVGFWHTHPDHPSRPSQYDADHAWPSYAYVIVSVREGKAAGEQCWILDTESPPTFREEPLTP